MIINYSNKNDNNYNYNNNIALENIITIIVTSFRNNRIKSSEADYFHTSNISEDTNL